MFPRLTRESNPCNVGGAPLQGIIFKFPGVGLQDIKDPRSGNLTIYPSQRAGASGQRRIKLYMCVPKQIEEEAVLAQNAVHKVLVYNPAVVTAYISERKRTWMLNRT